MVLHHPLRQDGPSAADDAGDASRGQGDVLHQHARMDGHVIDALLGLFFDDLQQHVDGQVLDAAHARESLIDGHGSDGHRRIRDDRFANARNVAAGGEIHHRVGAVLHGVAQLFELFVNVRRCCRVADVRVDLAARGHADAHRLKIGVIDVGGDDEAPTGDLVAHKFGAQSLALRDKPHLSGDRSLAGVMELRPDGIVHSGANPVTAHTCDGSAPRTRGGSRVYSL